MPRFGRLVIGGRKRPLCTDHYDAIVEANGRRNAWLADADRPIGQGGA